MANTDLTIKYKSSTVDVKDSGKIFENKSSLSNNNYKNHGIVSLEDKVTKQVTSVNLDNDFIINPKNSQNISVRTMDFFSTKEQKDSKVKQLEISKKQLEELRREQYESHGFISQVNIQDTPQMKALAEEIQQLEASLNTNYIQDPTFGINTININGEQIKVQVQKEVSVKDGILYIGKLDGTNETVSYRIKDNGNGNSSINFYKYPANFTGDPIEALSVASQEARSQSIVDNHNKFFLGNGIVKKDEATRNIIAKRTNTNVLRNSNLLEKTKDISGYVDFDYSTGNLGIVNTKTEDGYTQQKVVLNTYSPSQYAINSGIIVNQNKFEEKNGNTEKAVDDSIVAFNNSPTVFFNKNGNRKTIAEVVKEKSENDIPVFTLNTPYDLFLEQNGVNMKDVPEYATGLYSYGNDSSNIDKNNKVKVYGQTFGASGDLATVYTSFLNNVGHSRITSFGVNGNNKVVYETLNTNSVYGDDKLNQILNNTLAPTFLTLDKVLATTKYLDSVDGLNIVAPAISNLANINTCLATNTSVDAIDECMYQTNEFNSSYLNFVGLTGNLPFGTYINKQDQNGNNKDILVKNNQALLLGIDNGDYDIKKETEGVVHASARVANFVLRNMYGIYRYNQTAINHFNTFFEASYTKDASYDQKIIDILGERSGNAFINSFKYNSDVLDSEHNKYYQIGFDENGNMTAMESSDGYSYTKTNKFGVDYVLDTYLNNVGMPYIDREVIKRNIQNSANLLSGSDLTRIASKIAQDTLGQDIKTSHVLLSQKCNYIQSETLNSDKQSKFTTEFSNNCNTLIYNSKDDNLAKSNYIASEISGGTLGTKPLKNDIDKYNSQYNEDVQEINKLLQDEKVRSTVETILKSNGLTANLSDINHFVGYAIISNKDRDAVSVVNDLKTVKGALNKLTYTDSTGHKINLLDDYKYFIAEESKYREQAKALNRLTPDMLRSKLNEVYKDYTQLVAAATIYEKNLNETALNPNASYKDRQEALDIMAYVQERQNELVTHGDLIMLQLAASKALSKSNTNEEIHSNAVFYDIGKIFNIGANGGSESSLDKGYYVKNGFNPVEIAKNMSPEEFTTKLSMMLTSDEFEQVLPSILGNTKNTYNRVQKRIHDRNNEIKIKNNQKNNKQENNKQSGKTTSKANVDFGNLLAMSDKLNSGSNKPRKLSI